MTDHAAETVLRLVEEYNSGVTGASLFYTGKGLPTGDSYLTPVQVVEGYRGFSPMWFLLGSEGEWIRVENIFPGRGRDRVLQLTGYGPFDRSRRRNFRIGRSVKDDAQLHQRSLKLDAGLPMTGFKTFLTVYRKRLIEVLGGLPEPAAPARCPVPWRLKQAAGSPPRYGRVTWHGATSVHLMPGPSSAAALAGLLGRLV